MYQQNQNDFIFQQPKNYRAQKVEQWDSYRLEESKRHNNHTVGPYLDSKLTNLYKKL